MPPLGFVAGGNFSGSPAARTPARPLARAFRLPADFLMTLRGAVSFSRLPDMIERLGYCKRYAAPPSSARCARRAALLFQRISPESTEAIAFGLRALSQRETTRSKCKNLNADVYVAQRQEATPSTDAALCWSGRSCAPSTKFHATALGTAIRRNGAGTRFHPTNARRRLELPG